MNLIETYNPANAANLTEQEISAMQNLTKEEIAALAEAYPNSPQSNNYLLLIDKRLPADKQLYQMSSWKNLKDLLDLAQTHFVAFGFRGAAQTIPQAVADMFPNKTVVDLSEEDASKAEGLKPLSTPLPFVEGQGGVREVSQFNDLHSNVKETTDKTVKGEILTPVQNPVVDASHTGQINTNNDAVVSNLEQELAELKKEGAHHMKIKSVEKQIADLRGNQ